MCRALNNYDVKVESIYARGRQAPEFYDYGLVNGTEHLYKSYSNGMLSCTFRRSLTVPSESQMYMLDITKPQWTLWAVGDVNARTGSPRGHDFRRTTNGPFDILFRYQVHRYTFHSWHLLFFKNEN